MVLCILLISLYVAKINDVDILYYDIFKLLCYYITCTHGHNI